MNAEKLRGDMKNEDSEDAAAVQPEGLSAFILHPSKSGSRDSCYEVF